MYAIYISGDIVEGRTSEAAYPAGKRRKKRVVWLFFSQPLVVG